MNDTIRIWRSPLSAFGHFQRQADSMHEETVTALDAYSDEELAKIAASGFNAIWVHGNLNNVVETAVFPELGLDAELHQQRLNSLAERAARHGVKVFMYCQPPRAIPAENPFWQQHPDVAGQAEIMTDDHGKEVELLSLCTSTDKVKTFLHQAAAELAKKVPALGGIIMITASEYPSHCWARRGRIMLADGSFVKAEMQCPRCAARKPESVVAEIINLVRDGIRSVSKDMKIIAWNWSWTFYVPAPCDEIISALPEDVILLVDFERGGRKVILGKERIIDEYSLGFAGPSEQFTKSLHAAEKRGLKVMAKLQFGTTHELATVPNIPVLGNVFAKADAVRKMGLAGFMGCWNFGNMITANTAGFNAFLSGKLSDNCKTALQAFAAEYFPGCATVSVAAAWLKFGEAMDCYPFSIPFLYSGPANFAFILPMEPAPLTGKLVGRSWLLDERGDDMSAALTDYSIEEIIASFEQLSALWHEGMETFRTAVGNSTPAMDETATVRVCYHMFRSIVNFCKVYHLRKHWNDGLLPAYQVVITDEIANLEEVLPILEHDSRFGYHIEAHGYQYTATAIRKKLESLQ